MRFLTYVLEKYEIDAANPVKIEMEALGDKMTDPHHYVIFTKTQDLKPESIVILWEHEENKLGILGYSQKDIYNIDADDFGQIKKAKFAHLVKAISGKPFLAKDVIITEDEAKKWFKKLVKSKDEAKDKFYNMHGISLTRDQAELAYKDAIKRRFPMKQQTQANFKKQIESKYQIIEGMKAHKDTYDTYIEIWRENNKVLAENFDLSSIFPKQYLDKVSADSENPTTLELEINYNITKGYKGDFDTAPEGPDVEITSVTAYFDNKTKFDFDKILDIKKGKYTMHDLWIDAIIKR